MPEKRWWNFEDSYIDFGSVSPKTNNIASLILMEFAFIHSADWYIAPLEMKVGTVNKISSFSVKDCFGDEVSIEPAGLTSKESAVLSSDKAWDSWNMFSLSRNYENVDSGKKQLNTSYFFLPPSIDYSLASPSLEEIKFLRDETANLAWAVEKKFRTYFGQPVDGYDYYTERKKKLEETSTTSSSSPPPSSSSSSSSSATDSQQFQPVKYTLMSQVPWNWIPFTPVHTTEFIQHPTQPSPQMNIELQRGAMLNLLTGEPLHPNSKILNELQPKYYIDESEIPTIGSLLIENCKRAVWHNGQTFLWIARKEILGTGEGSSGLKFDVTDDKR